MWDTQVVGKQLVSEELRTNCGTYSTLTNFKTIELPRFLYEAGWTSDGSLIACTQPRRLAAISVATHVSEEMNSQLGEIVGYSVRFEDTTTNTTKIKYVTDGLLLREALLDPLLRRYSIIMIDEAHERTISTDILLGLLKKILRFRKNLRVIISSATVLVDEFEKFFKKASHGKHDLADALSVAKICVEGKLFPVDILYLSEPCQDYVTATVNTIIKIHQSEPIGDILAFVTGRDEVNSILSDLLLQLEPLKKSKPFRLLPLYAGLPRDDFQLLFEPSDIGERKIIVSTNVAETSVTIDGVKYVIDCGVTKEPFYYPETGITKIISVSESKASAIQRAGRAGRTSSGKCFRLYPESCFKDNTIMSDAIVPEIQRIDITGMIVQLKALGIENVVQFDYLTSPDPTSMASSLEHLNALRVIDDYGKLTKPDGEFVAELPLDPRMASCLVRSHEHNCTKEILSITAMITIYETLYINSPNGNRSYSEADRYDEQGITKLIALEGDHITLLNIFQAFLSRRNNKSPTWARKHGLNYQALLKAESVRRQLEHYMERLHISKSNINTIERGNESKGYENSKVHDILRCLVGGYFDHSAKMLGNGSLELIAKDRDSSGGVRIKETGPIWIHPDSVLFHQSVEYVIFQGGEYRA